MKTNLIISFTCIILFFLACKSQESKQVYQEEEQVQVVVEEQEEDIISEEAPFWDNCHCEAKTKANLNMYCDTTYLNDKSFYYYQINCDSIWLTLEKKNGEKLPLISYATDLVALDFRDKYYLCKEYSNHILFRHSCYGMNPCMFKLIDKKTGKVLPFEEQPLIHDFDADDRPRFYDFLLYLGLGYSDSSEKHKFTLVVHYVDTNHIFEVPIDLSYCKIYPQFQFDEIVLNGDILNVQYRNFINDDCKKDEVVKIKIDLKKERLIK